jgi:LmbE family N-acetylglucosaminyl deacetylase
MDELSTQGAVATEEVVDSAVEGDPMAKRRLEDETFAAFAEGSIVFLDLPDAVFRGYANDEELLNTPRPDDRAPYELLRREIARLEPQKLYLPLGIGNHVDHQLCRDVGVRLLAEGRRWVMPGPDYAGIVTFYEDFPYAWWNDFNRLDDLPAAALQDLPPDVALAPDYADIGDQLERKITGITIYESQIERLFTSPKEMARQVRAQARKTALLGGWGGSAERYWSTGPA